jgi:8-oxo-dGTP pyrophosphatase MutT (NUDIX family)
MKHGCDPALDNIEPVVPRDAASLLVVRGLAGPPEAAEILLGRRAAGHRFMPNVLVFPGGAVEAGDFTAVAACPLPPAEITRLEKNAPAGLGHALAMAAARELQEEVSLSLGSPPALDGLTYLCRAITPAASPIRFDARFFVVDADRVMGSITASHEIEDPGWYSMTAAMGFDLAGATRSILEILARRLQRGRANTEIPVLRERNWSLD